MEKITVLMTTYNENGDVIKQAIDSILNQTYSNFEFLIIVDNPQNLEIVDILNKYAEADKRIKLVINEKNLGLPLALNKGIELIQTKYLARMDADDISLPDRLEKQLNYMEANPDISLIGTNVTYINYKGDLLYNRGNIATQSRQLRIVMKYMNMFNHPTFFGKTEIFKKYMYRNLRFSQDYDFTCRLLENGEKIENLPEHLLFYRVVKISNPEKRIYQRITKQCIQKQYKKGQLSDVEINRMVDKCIKETDSEKMIRDMDKYDANMELIRNHKYIQGAIKLLILFIQSKTAKKDIQNLFVYAFFKKKYKF